MLGELAMAAALMCGTHECAPHCQHAVISENSGEGPTYHVLICDALKDSDGEGWSLIVDGSPLQNGAIIFGSIRP